MTVAVLDEPLLEFADRQRHIDPRFGIANYGPADRDNEDAPTAINVGLVGDARSVEGARSWLERCQAGLPAKADND